MRSPGLLVPAMPGALTIDAAEALFPDDPTRVLDLPGPPARPKPAPEPEPVLTLDEVPLVVVVKPGEVGGHDLRVRVDSKHGKSFGVALHAVESATRSELEKVRQDFLNGEGGRELKVAGERLATAKSDADRLAGELARARSDWSAAVAGGDDARAGQAEFVMDQLRVQADRAAEKVSVLTQAATRALADARANLIATVERHLRQSYADALAAEEQAVADLTAALSPAFRTWLRVHTRRAVFGKTLQDGRGIARLARIES